MIQRLVLFVFSTILFLSAAPALASKEKCVTVIGGSAIELEWDTEEDAIYANMTFREVFFHGWGQITCPTFVTLRHMTPELSDEDRAVFCLQYNVKEKTYTSFSLGERDAFLRCKAPSKKFCTRVNAAKDAALAIAGIGAGATAGASVASSAAGVAAVTHSSGAVILTGSAGYLAGTLGTAGASILAFLTAPVTIAAGSVSLVAVGGAVYGCREGTSGE